MLAAPHKKGNRWLRTVKTKHMPVVKKDNKAVHTTGIHASLREGGGGSPVTKMQARTNTTRTTHLNLINHRGKCTNPQAIRYSLNVIQMCQVDGLKQGAFE